MKEGRKGRERKRERESQGGRGEKEKERERVREGERGWVLPVSKLSTRIHLSIHQTNRCSPTAHKTLVTNKIWLLIIIEISPGSR